MMIGVDYFDLGVAMYRRGEPCPNYDGIALTAWIIDGWKHAAKVAQEPGYECECVSFDHKTILR
jgi:hypothetical protein